MKKSSIDNLSIDDLSIGKALSKSIGNLGKGDCPSFEEIAALIDKRVKGKRRDEIMKHLSICDKCYKIFLMSSHLIEKKSTRKYHIFHPMALAASVVIVLLSIFLFYKSNIIPKTSKQLIEESKVSSPDVMISKKKGIVLQEGEEVRYERAPLVSSKKDKIQKKDIEDVTISKKMGIENKNLEERIQRLKDEGYSDEVIAEILVKEDSKELIEREGAIDGEEGRARMRKKQNKEKREYLKLS